jgi:hypothetical protein
MESGPQVMATGTRPAMSRNASPATSAFSISSRLGKSALHRHKLHLPAALTKAREAEQVARADGLLEQLIELTDEARRLKQKAEAKKDYRTALAAVRELCRIVELVARINGELKESQINVVNVRLDEPSATRVAEIWLARHNHEQP